MNLDRAFRVTNGISLGDKAFIFEGSVSPTVTGFSAPKGSLYLRYGASYGLFQKVGDTDTDWTAITNSSGTLHANLTDLSTSGHPSSIIAYTNAAYPTITEVSGALDYIPTNYANITTATVTAAKFNTSATAPTNVNRLNYEGYLYATRFYGNGYGLTGTAGGAYNGILYNASSVPSSVPGLAWDGTTFQITVPTKIATANVTSTSISSLYLYTTDTQAANKGGQISFGGIYASSSDALFGTISARKENSTSGNTSSYMSFCSSDWSIGNIERFRINSKGNFGIQTTSPSANFQVSQVTLGTGFASNTADPTGVGGLYTTTITGNTTQFTNTFKVGDIITINATALTITVITSDTAMTATKNASIPAQSDQQYTLSGGNRFFVKGNGLVGIGASPVTYPLEVTGDIYSTANIRGNGQYLTGIGSTTQVIYNNAGVLTGSANLVFNSSSQLGLGISPSFKLHIASLAISNEVTYDTYSSYYADSNKLYFRKSAQSTVGNTTTVSGDILCDIRFQGNNGSGFWAGSRLLFTQSGAIGTDTGAGGPPATPVNLTYATFDGTNTADRLTILNTGKVGINTTIPLSLLSLGNTVDPIKFLLYDNNNFAKYGFGVQSNELRQFYPTDSHMSFGTIATTDGSTWSEKMRITQYGNIFVNTTSASSYVPETNGWKGLEIKGGATNSYPPYIFLRNSTDTAMMHMYLTSTGAQIGTSSATNLAINTQDSAKLTIDTNGITTLLSYGTVIGILQLYDSNVGIYRGSAATVSAGNFLNLAGYGGIVFTSSAAALGAQTERMRIASDGKVGIGCTATYTLQVKSTTQAIIVVEGTATNDYPGFLMIPDQGSTYASQLYKVNTAASTTWGNNGTYGDTVMWSRGDIVFSPTTGTAYSPKMRIQSDGKVGIGGTTVPRNMLEVTSGAANTNSDITGTAASFISATPSGQSSTVSIESNDAGLGADTGGVLGFGGRYSTTQYANWASIKGLKNTAGTGNYGGYLSFYTRPDGAANSIERMRIFASGAIQLNSVVYGTAITDGTRTTYIDANGHIGGISSIKASKDNIQPITDSSWLQRINPVTFQYKKKDDKNNYTTELEKETMYGMIAEEVEQINKDLCVYIDGKLQSIHYDRFIPPIIAELQRIQKQIDILKGV